MPRKKVAAIPEQESLPMPENDTVPEMPPNMEEPTSLESKDSDSPAFEADSADPDGSPSSGGAVAEESTNSFMPELQETPDESPLADTEDDFSLDPLEAEKRLEKEIALLTQAAEADEPNADAEPESETEALTDPSSSNLPEPASRELATRPTTPLTTKRASRESFFQIDFRKDRRLSQQEQQEWNDIYASFRSRSILTGTVLGVDENEIPIRDPKTGSMVPRIIRSLVIVAYRIKVLIPENEVFFKGEERGTFVMRGMMGAQVDYVITNVDKEGMCAIGSRTMALTRRRRSFSAGRRPPRAGDIVECSVLSVGPAQCTVTCGGYDVTLSSRDMSYTPILDLREEYRAGQQLQAVILNHAPGEALLLSVKEAQPNPFIGADVRHPAGQRRHAMITGKHAGGVFCTLADGTVVLCLYSNYHQDSEFMLGDSAIVYIEQYNYDRQQIYGRIVAKW